MSGLADLTLKMHRQSRKAFSCYLLVVSKLEMFFPGKIETYVWLMSFGQGVEC